jgi:uncharacterized protein YutE (UPF0331/DUF86 family)
VVDRDLVKRRRLSLEQYLRELREVVAVGREAYLADWKIQRAAERTLQLAVEVCLDLAEHVIADHRLPVPETAAGAFDALRDARIIEPELATALVRMARFRNLLVHDYVRIDSSKVFDIATTNVVEMERFGEVVRNLD